MASDVPNTRRYIYVPPGTKLTNGTAAADSKAGRDRAVVGAHERIEASWRERALNAEAGLGRTQQEVLTQRQRIGELMGQLRDTEQMIPGDGVPATLTENTTLKRRVQQLTQEHRALQERLEGARSNLRFAETRIAVLEVQVLEPEQAQT